MTLKYIRNIFCSRLSYKRKGIFEDKIIFHKKQKLIRKSRKQLLKFLSHLTIVHSFSFLLSKHKKPFLLLEVNKSLALKIIYQFVVNSVFWTSITTNKSTNINRYFFFFFAWGPMRSESSVPLSLILPSAWNRESKTERERRNCCCCWENKTAFGFFFFLSFPWKRTYYITQQRRTTMQYVRHACLAASLYMHALTQAVGSSSSPHTYMHEEEEDQRYNRLIHPLITGLPFFRLN